MRSTGKGKEYVPKLFLEQSSFCCGKQDKCHPPRGPDIISCNPVRTFFEWRKSMYIEFFWPSFFIVPLSFSFPCNILPLPVTSHFTRGKHGFYVSNTFKTAFTSMVPILIYSYFWKHLFFITTPKSFKSSQCMLNYR